MGRSRAQLPAQTPRLVVIDHGAGRGLHGRAYALARIYPERPDDLFWGVSDITYGSLTDAMQIVKDLAMPADDDDDGMDAVEAAFYREFYPIAPSEPSASSGWLAPTGEFYACRREQHEFLATILCAHVYGTPEGLYRLVRAHWIKLDELIGVVDLHRQRRVTQAQIDTIGRLAEAGPDDWQCYMTLAVDVFTELLEAA